MAISQRSMILLWNLFSETTDAFGLVLFNEHSFFFFFWLVQGSARSGSIKWIFFLVRSGLGNQIRLPLNLYKLGALYKCFLVSSCNPMVQANPLALLLLLPLSTHRYEYLVLYTPVQLEFVGLNPDGSHTLQLWVLK